MFQTVPTWIIWTRSQFPALNPRPNRVQRRKFHRSMIVSFVYLISYQFCLLIVLSFTSVRTAITNRLYIKESIKSCIDKLATMGLEVSDEYHYLIGTILNSCDFNIDAAAAAITRGNYLLTLFLTYELLSNLSCLPFFAISRHDNHRKGLHETLSR